MIQGAKPFPVASFRDESNQQMFFFCRNHKLNENYPPHIHDYFEIEIVVSGKGKQFLNGIPVNLERGSAHILSTTDVHDLTVLEPLDICKIMVHPEQGDEKITREILNNLGIVKFNEKELSEVILLTEMLIDEESASEKDSMSMIHQLLRCIIIKFSRQENLSTRINPNPQNKYIKDAINYIMLNYINDISSADIAEYLNINAAYFSTMFRKFMNFTVTEYITNLRLRRAETMLSMGIYSVSEVCYACGFNSVSNFYRVFKLKYGIAPSELKRKR